MTTEESLLQNPYSLILKNCLPRPWKVDGRYWNNGSTDVDFFLLPHQIEVWFTPRQHICVGYHLEGWHYVFDINDPEIVIKLREGLIKMARKKIVDFGAAKFAADTNGGGRAGDESSPVR